MQKVFAVCFGFAFFVRYLRLDLLFDFLFFLSLLEPLFQGFRPVNRHKSGFGAHNTDRRRLYAKSKIKQKIKNSYTPQFTNQTAHRSSKRSGRGVSKFRQRPHSNRRFGQLYRDAGRSDRSQARTGRRRSIKIKICCQIAISHSRYGSLGQSTVGIKLAQNEPGQGRTCPRSNRTEYAARSRTQYTQQEVLLGIFPVRNRTYAECYPFKISPIPIWVCLTLRCSP